MQRRLTLLLVATLIAGACSSDTPDTPTTPSTGTSRLAIAPQPDFLTMGTSLTLEARLTEGVSPPRVVPADWSSSDGRVVAVERTGRVSALGPGTTTIKAVFGSDSATLAVRVAPDFTGTWTGPRRITGCVHPKPEVCATSYPTNSIAQTTLTLTQARDRVSGTLGFSPLPVALTSAVTGSISDTGRLTLDGAIISTPATGASTTLGTLAEWRTEIETTTGIRRGSFVEARRDPDGTTWRVSWEIQGLTRTR
jgi:hypothetical protein